MNTNFENQLRAALRPVDPDEGFADAVMRRIGNEQQQRRWVSARSLRWPAAIAAAAVLAIVLIHSWRAAHERRGLEARQQLIDAMHLTGDKLDLAYRGVNDASRSIDDPGV